MRKIMLASVLLAALLVAACDDDRPAGNADAGNWVEAAPYPDGTQK